jgi:hypothetical protein
MVTSESMAFTGSHGPDETWQFGPSAHDARAIFGPASSMLSNHGSRHRHVNVDILR